jgi:hypothetical protein
MSSTIRRSPRIASKPPVTYYPDEDTSTNKTTSNTYKYPIDDPINKSIIDSALIIGSLLKQIENTKGSDVKCPLINKLFTHLIHNTDILIYKPFFRNTVINKIKQFQLEIPIYISSLKQDTLFQDIISFQNSMSTHLRNYSCCNIINNHIERIKSTVSSINTDHYEDTLDLANHLLEIIDGLMDHPNYVP